MSKLAKSSNDKVIGGVCSGIADFFGISPFVVRILFLITCPGSVWIYVILHFVLDTKPTLLK